jgi:hypothetical protein
MLIKYHWTHRQTQASHGQVPDINDPRSAAPLPLTLDLHPEITVTLLFPKKPPFASSPSSMANFAVDPTHHVPVGFELSPHDPDLPPTRLYAYISGSCETCNEDLSIAYFTPGVAKEDFEPMAAALKNFFIQSHGVYLVEVQPCSLGDAYVRFKNPLERDFLIESFSLARSTRFFLASMMRLRTLGSMIWIEKLGL